MQAIIVSIGDELILGQTVDSNAAWLGRELAGLGAKVSRQVTVGDEMGAIADQLRRVSEEAELVIVTGGLGPTDDDLTRHALAEVLGVKLQLHQPSLEKIQQFYIRLDRPMPQTNVIQAMIPPGCRVLDNEAGTAPGMAAHIGRAKAYFLPGVPAEMKNMFRMCVRDELKKLALAQGGGLIVTRTLHVFGTGESNVAQMLDDMMTRGRNPLVNSTAADGIISLRINARAADEGQARRLIEPVEGRLRERLGDLIFGADEDTLSSVVGAMLRQQRAKLAVAESCTGGMLARFITDTAGASDYFIGGWVVYSNQAKSDFLRVDAQLISKYGAVSEQAAGALADNARRLANSDFALGVTGIAGPGGGSPEKPLGLVYIALASGDGVKVMRSIFPGDRQRVRLRAVYTAVDMLRRKLLGAAVPVSDR